MNDTTKGQERVPPSDHAAANNPANNNVDDILGTAVEPEVEEPSAEARIAASAGPRVDRCAVPGTSSVQRTRIASR